jgi:hypothetical protein
VPAESELVGLEPKGEPNELGQVEHRQAQLAPDHGLRRGLLQVEV